MMLVLAVQIIAKMNIATMMTEKTQSLFFTKLHLPSVFVQEHHAFETVESFALRQ
jgi:hypothetical protein